MFKKAFILFIFVLACISASFAQHDRITFGSFGEMHYNDVIHQGGNDKTPGTINFRRLNLLINFNLNDWVSFHSDVGLRHTPGEGKQINVYQAYADLNIRREFGIRAGILLVPSGYTNLNRSPVSFHGVERSNVEKYIIPATWKAAGLGVYGEYPIGISYQAYLLSGLDPAGITGENGIRSARQNGLQFSTANPAFIGRLDYQLRPNLQLGTSYYISLLNNTIENGSAQKLTSLEGVIFNMGEGHIKYKRRRFVIRGLFALSKILDVDDLNETFGNRAGEIQAGGYVEVAYDILPFFIRQPEQELWAFARGESYDTNFVTRSIPRNNEYLREELTLGFTYKPIPQMVFKADFQFLTSLGSKYMERLNIGVGYSF